LFREVVESIAACAKTASAWACAASTDGAPEFDQGFGDSAQSRQGREGCGTRADGELESGTRLDKRKTTRCAVQVHQRQLTLKFDHGHAIGCQISGRTQHLQCLVPAAHLDEHTRHAQKSPSGGLQVPSQTCGLRDLIETPKRVRTFPRMKVEVSFKHQTLFAATIVSGLLAQRDGMRNPLEARRPVADAGAVDGGEEQRL